MQAKHRDVLEKHGSCTTFGDAKQLNTTSVTPPQMREYSQGCDKRTPARESLPLLFTPSKARC